MGTKEEKILKSFKNEIAMASSGMEKAVAAQFFSELADWAYANSEAMLIDDELDEQDCENK